MQAGNNAARAHIRLRHGRHGAGNAVYTGARIGVHWLPVRACSRPTEGSALPGGWAGGWRGAVPKLRRRAQQQRLRDDRQPLHYGGCQGGIAHPRRRTDAQATHSSRSATRSSCRSLMSTSSPSRSTFSRSRPTSVGTAGKKLAVRALPHCRDRTVDVTRAAGTGRWKDHAPRCAPNTSTYQSMARRASDTTM
jgi:hypothetical protein